MLKSVHLEEVRNARRQVLYYKEYARLHPNEMLFVSVDRMEQSKTCYPNTYRFVFYFLMTLRI
jgi:hypothetical protein